MQQGRQWSAAEAVSNFRIEIARCRKCVPVDEARCGQAGSKRGGAQRSGQGVFRSAHFPPACDHLRRRRRNRYPGEIRHFSMGLLCSAHLCEGNGTAFQPELEALGKKGRLHALNVGKCTITGQSTSLEKQDT